MAKPQHDTEPDAETIAIAALSWLATEPDLLGRFVALTGIGPSSLRAAAQSPDFLASVLDFIMQDDRTVLAVARGQEIAPEAIARARHKLESAEAVRPE